MKNQNLYWKLFILFISIFFVSTLSIASTSKQKLILSDPTRPDLAKLRTNRKNTTANGINRSQINKLRLQQTFISQFKKIAVINGKSMTVGNNIRGAKLIKINSNNVVLNRKGKFFTLHLTFSSDIKEVSGH